MLKCPHCYYEGDRCNFSDLFYKDYESTQEIIEQEKLLNEIQSHKLNVVI